MPQARDTATAVATGAIDAIWRIESPRLIAGLARILRDLPSAEDVAQDALLRALETWPRDGVPDNPGAWLMTTAKRIAIDRLRRARTGEHVQEQLEWLTASHAPHSTSSPPSPAADPADDDLLALMFTCCHPALSHPARTTLTLRLLGGLKTDDIARAFHTSEPAIAQRISRAKRTLAESGAGFSLPAPEDFPSRLDSLLQVLYLVFNEGHTATSGDDWLRADLCFDALRLARTLAALAPHEPEVHGLVALMDFQASRLRARTAPDGSPVLLMDQDRSRWDRTLITHGLTSLARAQRLSAAGAAGAADSGVGAAGAASAAGAAGAAGGPYLAQAAIAACHASAPTPESTDWVRIAALYEALLQLQPSPIIQLNRAVAISHAFGPATALPLIDQLIATDLLSTSHLLPAVRADLLIRLHRTPEAIADLHHAATLTRNTAERDLLLARATALEAAAG